MELPDFHISHAEKIDEELAARPEMMSDRSVAARV